MQPGVVFLGQEVVQEQGDLEFVGLPVGMELRQGQSGFAGEAAHGADASALGLRQMQVVHDGGDGRVAKPRPRGSELFRFLEGVANVEDLNAVAVTDDLGRAVQQVVAVHDCVGQRFTNHLARQDGFLPAVQITLWKVKALGQFVDDAGFGLRQGQQQWLANVDGLEALLGILHPLGASNADVVDAQHRHETAQGHRFAE